MLRPAATIVLLSCALACGNQPDPAKPTSPADSVAPAGSTAPVASGDPEVVGENPAKPRPRKPFPIHSSCPQVVTLVFGEDANAPGAGLRTVASNSEIEGPRDAEGKATVVLLDEKGEPIAKVHINRGMKQLEIGRSCRTLDAR